MVPSAAFFGADPVGYRSSLAAPRELWGPGCGSPAQMPHPSSGSHVIFSQPDQTWASAQVVSGRVSAQIGAVLWPGCGSGVAAATNNSAPKPRASGAGGAELNAMKSRDACGPRWGVRQADTKARVRPRPRLCKPALSWARAPGTGAVLPCCEKITALFSRRKYQASTSPSLNRQLRLGQLHA